MSINSSHLFIIIIIIPFNKSQLFEYNRQVTPLPYNIDSQIDYCTDQNLFARNIEIIN